MSSGFLGLAYIAEVSIVFNLAYSELRNRRYVEYAEGKINILRSKLGKQEMILRDHSLLYSHLDGLTDNDPKKRNTAWACCDQDGFRHNAYSWFLSRNAYPFYMDRRDKAGAMWCCGLSVLIIIFATLLDHFEKIQPPLPEYFWCIYLTILLLCIIYPVATVFVGRKMMKRLDKVASHLEDEFKKIVEPSIKTAISTDIENLTKAASSSPA